MCVCQGQFEVLCIVVISNGSVHHTIVCKRSNLEWDVEREIIDVEQKEQTAQHSALWYSESHRYPVWMRSINDHPLFACCQEVGDPYMHIFCNAVFVEFVKESVVWYRVKGLWKIHDYDVYLSVVLKCLYEVMNRLQELWFAWMFGRETMLFVS